jgi:WD40 repeat protein
VICAVPDGEMILGTSCGRLFGFDPRKGTTGEITFGEGTREDWILDVAVLRGKRWEWDSLVVLVRDTGRGGLARLVFMHRTKSNWVIESEKELPKDWGRISRMSVDRDGVRCWVSTFSGLRELQLSGGLWHPKANPITPVNAWAVASSHGTQDLLATMTNAGPWLWRVSDQTYSSLGGFPPHLSANPIRVAALALDPKHNTLAVATSNPHSTRGTFWLAEVPPQGQDLLEVTNWPQLSVPISQFAFAPDGEMLACGSTSGVISLLVPGSDSPPQDLRGHQATVNALSFSSDGRYLVSGDAQGEVFLWHMEIESLIQATDQLLGR